MDIKCKKLILLIMNINSAQQLKLKITNTKIINMEMFTNVCITLIIIYYLTKYSINIYCTLLITDNAF